MAVILVNCLTQESIVGVGGEDLFGTIEEEPEWQEDLYIWPLDQNALVDLGRVAQMANADCVRALDIADGVQWIKNLRRKKWVILRSPLL